MVEPDRNGPAVHTPVEENRRKYLPLMPIFDECYHSLAGVYDRLGEIGGVRSDGW